MYSVAETIIQMSHVGFNRDQRQILTDINLDVRKGDFLAITGPNGGGKTTLLRLMLKLLKPSTGTVTYHFGAGMTGRRQAVGYLPQKNMIDSHFPITVRQVVATGLINSGITASEEHRAVDDIITTVGLEDRADYPIGRLSGGQLQRALLGRAIISQPKLLVLDEPRSYVDKSMEHRIYDIIAGLMKTTTIVLVSHEMTRIATMANRHIIIDGGLTECSARHHYFAHGCS